MIPGPNWARRYRAHHRRLCARPGCESPAAATLRFHSTRREASLCDLDDALPRVEGDLCVRHAAALVLPRGWTLHDERTPEVSVLRPVAPAAPAAPAARVARVDVRVLPQVPPQLGATEVVPEEELADVLDARSPLLQRAFRNALPR